jgi:hypothetical protein
MGQDDLEIVERLDMLETKLEHEGRYVESNTAWLAKSRLKLIRSSIDRLAFAWDAEAAKHSSAAEDAVKYNSHGMLVTTEESCMHDLHALILHDCALAIRSVL